MAALVQATSTGATSKSLAFGSNLTAGSLLIAVVRYAQDGSNSLDGVSDTLNSGWTQLLGDTANGSLIGPSGSTYCSVWYFENSSAGPSTVNISTGSGSTRVRFSIAEFTPDSGAAWLTGAGAAQDQRNTSATTTLNSGSITVPSGSVLAIGGGAHDETDSFTANSGWTEATEGQRTQIQYQLAASAGSLESAPTVTVSAPNVGFIALYGVASAVTPSNKLTLLGVS